MNFISWSVFGILFMLAEFATGTLYMLAIGLAFIYPAIAEYAGASLGIQIIALSAGILGHALIVKNWHKRKPSSPPPNIHSDVGQRVEVIEWLDECTATVKFRGEEWQADKAKAEMPDAAYGIIQSVHGHRLIISTALPAHENT
ncbi:hypothetical protein GALLN_00870 [Gallionellaceae bacterium]|nr:hypothetical protein GALLN_00870 [Gallionellaceae bacterium]